MNKFKWVIYGLKIKMNKFRKLFWYPENERYHDNLVKKDWEKYFPKIGENK